MVMVLVNVCCSDVSPVNNSDSDTTFFMQRYVRLITTSLRVFSMTVCMFYSPVMS